VVFDEMSHHHHPLTSSKPAPVFTVFTFQCAALMSVVVLHARAAETQFQLHLLCNTEALAP
jgi:hypothetical protein